MPPKTTSVSPKNAAAPYRLRWSPEVVLSLLSLLISLCSVAFTIVQTEIMQSQQKASVWPYLEIRPRIVQNVFFLEVQNKGVGPAIVRKVEFGYRGKIYDNFEQVAQRIVNDSTMDYSNTLRNPIRKYVFSASEKVNVFEANDVRHATKLIYSTADIKINIRYASIYGDEWETNEKNELAEIKK